MTQSKKLDAIQISATILVRLLEHTGLTLEQIKNLTEEEVLISLPDLEKSGNIMSDLTLIIKELPVIIDAMQQYGLEAGFTLPGKLLH